MEKTRITNGVYWVAIPEKNFCILCGCPDNIVKHLIRRGLIHERETKGVKYETGPNAILLSEVPVQNGALSNLAEFPVLQMLYRQGMIVPGHPNNTGRKPMLIGLRDQIEAQSRYVYIGNYGLTSPDEIIARGLTPETARDFMRLKLKFAFGKILDTGDLVDLRTIDRDAVEVEPGIFIQRKGLNLYDIIHNGESASVDLNLEKNKFYATPYLLPFHQAQRSHFSIIHTGEGDGWDVNRPAMGSILSYKGEFYLVDAGPNIYESLLAMGININEVKGIFHTHAHDDHFTGLTSLMHSDRKIGYYATPLVRATVMKKLGALLSRPEDCFNEYFEVHDLVFDEWNDVDGLQVMPFLSPHPVETSIFSFRVAWEGGWKSYAHFADIVSMDVFAAMITDDPNAPGITREYFELVKETYLRPATIKKIDNGKGMIHGNALDFKDDASGLLLLSHSADELTEEEKAIASSVSFGTENVLIPATEDYLFKKGFDYLKEYFPTVPEEDLDKLLRGKRHSINEGTILIKTGTSPGSIFFILSGLMETINTETGTSLKLSSGTLAGVTECLRGTPVRVTYRTVTRAIVLEIPNAAYLDFVRRNSLHDGLMKIIDLRMFFQGTRLFGDMVSIPVLNAIVKSVTVTKHRAGEKIGRGNEALLMLIAEGRVRITANGRALETIGAGEFLGEERILFGEPVIMEAEAVVDTVIYCVPGATITGRPVILQKLHESFERRVRLFKNVFDCAWKPEYSVNVNRLDEQHRQIFRLMYAVHQALDEELGFEEADRRIRELIEFSEQHFETEEEMLLSNRYAGYDAQKQEHEKLLKNIRYYETKLADPDASVKIEFVDFMKDWLIGHMLLNDSRYRDHLNKMGIF
jgi:hemerythrin